MKTAVASCSSMMEIVHSQETTAAQVMVETYLDDIHILAEIDYGIT